MFSLRTPGRGGGRKGAGCSGRLAPGPLPAPRRAEESGPQFPQFLYHGATTHSHSASRLASPAFSVRAVRASCRLTQLRCWVAPSPEVSSPASGPAHFLRSRSSVRLRRCHTRPLFLHTSAGANPARSVLGSREAAVPAAGTDSVGINPPQTVPVHAPHQRRGQVPQFVEQYPFAKTVIPRITVCATLTPFGPSRPRRRRPSASPQRRSLPLLQGA